MDYAKGIIQTLIGTGEAGYSGDGKPAKNALLRDPFMCCFDNKGNIFIAEAKNHCVRRVDVYTNLITMIKPNLKKLILHLIWSYMLVIVFRMKI